MVLNNAENLMFAGEEVDSVYCNRALVWQRKAEWLYRFEEDGSARILAYLGLNSDLVVPSKIRGRRVKIVGYPSEERITVGGIMFTAASIKIPDSVEIIEEIAFAMSDMHTVVLGDGVTEIRKEAFYTSPQLASVTFGANLTRIMDYAFAGSFDRNYTPTAPPVIDLMNTKLEHVGASAFQRTGIGQIIFPPTLQTVGLNALYACPRLSSIVAPASAEGLFTNQVIGSSPNAVVTYY